MATPPYVPLNPNTPDGVTQAPNAYSASDIANVRAIRDMLVSGLGDAAWSFLQSPAGWQNPQYYLWINSAAGLRLQAAMTYNGGPSFGPATVTWYWSNDSGATYTQIGATVNLATDASGIVNTASSLSGSFLLALAARAIAVASFFDIYTHKTSNGTAVHGLGTISTQNANNVALTGGAISGIPISYCNMLNFGRIYPIAPAVIGAGDWNWASGVGNQQKIAPGTVIQIINAAAGEIKRLWVTGAGAITINNSGSVAFGWATGHPVWGAAATIVSCVAVEGNYVIGTTIPVG